MRMCQSSATARISKCESSFITLPIGVVVSYFQLLDYVGMKMGRVARAQEIQQNLAAILVIG